MPDLEQRLAAIRRWDVKPDYASVNVHEGGALHVIGALLDLGVGVEAGIWNAKAAITLRESGLANACLRILLEPGEDRPPSDAYANMVEIEDELLASPVPFLLHGYDGSAWQFVRLAASRGYQTRAGFEDSLLMPDGSVASCNADLVRAAVEVMGLSPM